LLKESKDAPKEPKVLGGAERSPPTRPNIGAGCVCKKEKQFENLARVREGEHFPEQGVKTTPQN